MHDGICTVDATWLGTVPELQSALRLTFFAATFYRKLMVLAEKLAFSSNKLFVRRFLMRKVPWRRDSEVCAQNIAMVHCHAFSFLLFQYLGCVEVFESRGMQVCEEAIKVLKVRLKSILQKKRLE